MRTFFLALFISAPLVSICQIDLSRYFNENSLPLVELEDHLPVEFKWNMSGAMQVHVNDALTNIDEEKFGPAITSLDEAIKLDPTLWIAYYYRGICYKQLRDAKNAEADFIKTQKLNPKLAESYVELGEIYHTSERLDDAEKQYNSAIGLSPSLITSYYNLGGLNVMKQDFKRAAKFYEKCIEINPRFPAAYMMLGVLKFKVKKNDNASIPLFDKALEVDSTYSNTYLWRGLAHLNLNQTEKGLADWNNLVRYNPQHDFYLLIRSFLLIELENYQQAFADMRKYFELREINENKFRAGYEKNIDKLIDLQSAMKYLIGNGYGLKEQSFDEIKKGFCLLIVNKQDMALGSLTKAEAIEVSAPVYYIKAIAHEHKGEHNIAYKYYDEALKMDNDIFDAHKKRGIYRMELKKWSLAKSDFNEMIRLEPYTVIAYRFLGFTKSHEGDYEGAIADLNKFADKDDSDPEVFRTIAFCAQMNALKKEYGPDKMPELSFDRVQKMVTKYLDQGDTTNAIVSLKFLNMTWTETFWGQLRLAEVYIARKMWTEADEEIIIALKKMNAYTLPALNSQALYIKGRCELNAKDYALSIKLFTAAVDIDGRNFNARYYRGKAFLESGDRKNAEKDFSFLSKKNHLDSRTIYLSLK